MSEQRDAIERLRKIKRLCITWPPNQAEDRLEKIREFLAEAPKAPKRSSRSSRDRAERGGRDREE